MGKRSAFDIEDYRYTLPPKVPMNRSPRFAGAITTMGWTKPESKFTDMFTGNFDRPTLRNDGLTVGPTGDEYYEFPTDKRYMKLANGEYPRLDEITDKDVSSVKDPAKRKALASALEQSKNTIREYPRTNGLGAGPLDLGEYTYSNEVGDAGKIRVAAGKPGNEYAIDSVSNTNTHEESHMMDNLFEEAYKYTSPTAKENASKHNQVSSGIQDNGNYDDRLYELNAQIGGNRNRYTKEMINDVHQYIDFSNGKFNTGPAKEALRRMKASGMQTRWDDDKTKDYMDLLEREAEKLNARADKDADWKDQFVKARDIDGDPHDWRTR